MHGFECYLFTLREDALIRNNYKEPAGEVVRWVKMLSIKAAEMGT